MVWFTHSIIFVLHERADLIQFDCLHWILLHIAKVVWARSCKLYGQYMSLQLKLHEIFLPLSVWSGFATEFGVKILEQIETERPIEVSSFESYYKWVDPTKEFLVKIYYSRRYGVFDIIRS